MYNKQLFEKICNVTCSFEELESFVIKIDKKEFDLEQPFEKYYDLDKILLAIKRYEDKEISDRYLAYWMNAYDWIVSGGFKVESKENVISFKKWLQWEISEWLDSLSFFDDSEDFYNLDKYKNVFTVLDKVYRTCDEWEIVFAHTEEFYDAEVDEEGLKDVVVLASNSKMKEFVKIYGELDYYTYKVQFARVELDALEKEVSRLKEEGYEELKCGTWDLEEDEKE